ncbi:MAG: hypothetical protein L6V35_02085 [Alistipes putredinis]|nr:MAG: hypothetical protein L6V35_02085 [Alistipes putredinis]
MRTRDGRILNADLHMEFFRRAVRRILDMPLAISERQINETTARLLRENLIPPDVPTEISVYLVLESDAMLPVISCREILLDRTYALQGTRPAAEIFEYSYPYPSFRTSVSDAASIPFENKAFSMSAAVSVRCENGVLLAARGEALLAMHGKNADSHAYGMRSGRQRRAAHRARSCPRGWHSGRAEGNKSRQSAPLRRDDDSGYARDYLTIGVRRSQIRSTFRPPAR